MRRFRVSIAVLLTGIALVGVTLAALIHPSPLWGNAYYSLALGTLIIAVLGAVFSRGPRRAFWVGFSACGWAYFLVVFGPEPLAQFQENLVTTALLDICYPFTVPKAAPETTPGGTGGSPSAQWKPSGRPASGKGLVILTGSLGDGMQPHPPYFSIQSAWDHWTEPDRIPAGLGSLSPLPYVRIGHTIFCLLFALIGGYSARRFQETRDRVVAG